MNVSFLRWTLRCEMLRCSYGRARRELRSVWQRCGGGGAERCAGRRWTLRCEMRFVRRTGAERRTSGLDVTER